jgi:predicted dehydrogenase
MLVEKPMVLDPADGTALLAIAAEAGVEILVGYPWHYNAQAIALRSAIATGRIGTIELATCTYGSTVREYYRGDTEAYQPVLQLARAPRAETYSSPALAGGGQGQTQLTHAAAMLLFVCGLEVEAVAAFTERFDLPVDLVDAVAVRFAGGAVGTLASTGGRRVAGDDLLELRIFGTAGEALIDVMAGTAVIRTAAGDEVLAAPVPADRYPHHAPAENLVDVASGAATNGSPGALGQATVELIDAMYRSAASGGAAIASRS